jgi:hypothetical protein
VAERASRLVGGLFLLLGLIFGGVALYLGIDPDARRLEARGDTARAELLRKELHASRVRGSTVRPEYRVSYRFGSIDASASIDEALWRRLSPGDPLEVRYLKEDPATHRVETQEREIVLPVVFGLIGAVFAPLGFALMRGRAPLLDRAIAWISRSPALALGSIGVAFFLPFFAGGVYWLDTVRGEEALLEARGRGAEGMVLSKAIVKKRSSSGSGARTTESTHYHATYRFRADSGEEVIGTSALDADAWEQLKERAPVPVAYVAGAPWLHRVQGWEPSWWPPILFLAVGGIGMAACGWLAWWGYGRPARRGSPPRRPEVRPGPQAPTAVPTNAARGWWWGAAFGGVFFFAGCGATIGGIGELRHEWRYAAEGKAAQARIVSKRIDEAQRGGRMRTDYVALYRFEAPDGAKGEGRAVLEVAAWEAARPGDAIAIRYLPGEPAANRPAGEGGWAYGIIISIVGPLFALIGAFVAWGAWLSRHDG